jgi:hypothetical protein
MAYKFIFAGKLTVCHNQDMDMCEPGREGEDEYKGSGLAESLFRGAAEKKSQEEIMKVWEEKIRQVGALERKNAGEDSWSTKVNNFLDIVEMGNVLLLAMPMCGNLKYGYFDVCAQGSNRSAGHALMILIPRDFGERVRDYPLSNFCQMVDKVLEMDVNNLTDDNRIQGGPNFNLSLGSFKPVGRKDAYEMKPFNMVVGG